MAHAWRHILLLRAILFLLGRRGKLHVVHLGFQQAMLVLQGDRCLVNFFVLKFNLLLLKLLLLELFVALDHVRLGELAKNLELVQELTLAIKKMSLLLEHVTKSLDLIFSVSVFYFDGGFNGSFHFFLALDLDLLYVNGVSKLLGLGIHLLLFNLENVKGFHQGLYTALSTGFEITDNFLRFPYSIFKLLALRRDPLGVLNKVIHILI